MSHLTHVVPGEPFKPAAGDWNAFVDTARTVRDQRKIFAQDPQQYSNEPQLFIALENFRGISTGGAEYCIGSDDALVGRSARLIHQPSFATPYPALMTYFRVEGEAHCVWMPAETDCIHGATGSPQKFKIGCGEFFWAIWNGQSGRYEAITPGRRQDLDSAYQTSQCPCKWYGFAIWKAETIDSVATWTLVENHCSGCYESESGHADTPVDLRFSVTGSNSDWLTTPSDDPAGWVGDPDYRRVTCCAVADDPPPPPCDLTCCYTAPVPLPSCTATSGTSQVIMPIVTGGAECFWTTDTISYPIWHTSQTGCCEPAHSEGTWHVDITLSRVTLTSTRLVYNLFVWVTQSDTFVGMGDCLNSNYGGEVVVTYNVGTAPDCTNDPTATKASVFWGFSNVSIGDCAWCGRDKAYIESLFQSSITVSRIACNETTTTGTSTSTSTTTGSTTTTASTTSTTTGSTTTSSSTTISSTTASSTTASTTTGSTTTGSTTTASSTTTACTGGCFYSSWSVGTGSPTGFYWFKSSQTCSTGCGCIETAFEIATAVGRWPTSDEDGATLPCT